MSLRLMIDKQRTLLDKFELIEVKNGVLEYPGTSLAPGGLVGQMKLRRYAWYITEEVCEALWAKLYEKEKVNYREEIADAFHFLLDLVIIAQVEAAVIEEFNPLEAVFESERVALRDASTETTFEAGWLEFLLALGMTMNLLKNKPWKQSTKPLQLSIFQQAVIGTFRRFVRACLVSNVTAQQLNQSYFRKAEVNEQRIASGV
jgi:dimeric dUTPase (all-alpha-NTP-PPase superfamily)